MKFFYFNKIALLSTLIGTSSYNSQANAGCITALQPYENHLGWAIFPFTNSCPDDVMVSVCIKSWPPGSSEPAYNSLGGTVPANGGLDLTDGMWKYYDSYKWQENAPQSCPFE